MRCIRMYVGYISRWGVGTLMFLLKEWELRRGCVDGCGWDEVCGDYLVSFWP